MNLQVQCISAKVGKMIELGSIYIKGNVTSGKIPAWISTKSSAAGFASLRRMWGTWSNKNLMKAHFGCRRVMSMPWAVKKAHMQSKSEI